MCEQLLANPLIESYEIELAEPRRRDQSAAAHRRAPVPGLERRPRRALGARRARRGGGPRLAHRDASCRDLDAVVLPGGFSYGDYLRCGAIARFAPAMAAVDGVRVRAAASCSESATASRSSAKRACCRACSAGTSRCRSSAATSRSPSSARTRRSRTAATRDSAAQRSPSSTARAAGTPTTSCTRSSKRGARSCCATRSRSTVLAMTLRAWSTSSGNVFGLMPHPEHAVDPLLGSADGGSHPVVARRVRPRSHSRIRLETTSPQCFRERGMLGESRTQTLEVAQPAA